MSSTKTMIESYVDVCEFDCDMLSYGYDSCLALQTLYTIYPTLRGLDLRVAAKLYTIFTASEDRRHLQPVVDCIERVTGHQLKSLHQLNTTKAIKQEIRSGRPVMLILDVLHTYCERPNGKQHDYGDTWIKFKPCGSYGTYHTWLVVGYDRNKLYLRDSRHFEGDDLLIAAKTTDIQQALDAVVHEKPSIRALSFVWTAPR